MVADDSLDEPLLAALTAKLDDMTLHDETGDRRGEGYMTAVRELRAWIAERARCPIR
jgi:hypothetical protein